MKNMGVKEQKQKQNAPNATFLTSYIYTFNKWC